MERFYKRILKGSFRKSQDFLIEIFIQILNILKFSPISTVYFSLNRRYSPEWCSKNGFVNYKEIKFTAIHQGFLSINVLDKIIREADRICDHKFDILGAGSIDFGEKINWHKDYCNSASWDSQKFYKRVRPAPYPGGKDIKYPWEMSRFQHLARLGQAYCLTENEKYAEEFKAQISDWIDQNPWPWGVNWSCTMDVALRAVSWLSSLSFFNDSLSFDRAFLETLLRSLDEHGHHIRSNLETRGVIGNHYLSNLLGLFYIGVLCPDLKQAPHWRDFAKDELEIEILRQVNPDGVNFEGSTSYHRLTTELFLSAAILASQIGISFSHEYMKRLELMLEFVMILTKPDGTVPLIGDHDNGRVHRFSIWDDPDREWVDFRYLLAIGAVLFDRSDFALAAGDQWQEAFWLLANRAFEAYKKFLQETPPIIKEKSRGFLDSGFYILRSEDTYMAVHAAPLGQCGNGGHDHNDALSFELFSGGVNWIVDPGTYTYTQDYNKRNQFRSISSHNTLQIGDIEPNSIPKTSLFHLDARSVVEIATWSHNETLDRLDMSLSYNTILPTALPENIQHKRKIIFSKVEKCWEITDIILGAQSLPIQGTFFLHPSIKVLTYGNDEICLSSRLNGTVKKLHIRFISVQNLEIEQTIGEVSKCYGRVEKTSVLHYMIQNGTNSEEIKIIIQMV